MITEKELNGLVLQCDFGGIIEEVLYNDLLLPPTYFIGKAFISIMDTVCLDKTLHFLSSIRQFGHAAGWELCIRGGETPFYLSFMGAKCRNGLLITGYLLVNPEAPMFTDETQKDGESEKATTHVQENPERLFADEELLDELSRLNNELINVKRELVKKNIELERQIKSNK